MRKPGKLGREKASDDDGNLLDDDGELLDGGDLLGDPWRPTDTSVR